MKTEIRIVKCEECNGTGYVNNKVCVNCNSKGEVKYIVDKGVKPSKND